MNTSPLSMLREIADTAFTLVEESRGTDQRAAKIHELAHSAIRAVLAAQRGEPCAGPACGNAVEYSGVGRPALYCSRRCRDRAAYVAKRRQRDSEERRG
jgi:hypothetical protein